MVFEDKARQGYVRSYTYKVGLTSVTFILTSYTKQSKQFIVQTDRTVTNMPIYYITRV